MASHTQRGAGGALLEVLVAHRMLVYLGGLVVIALPLLLQRVAGVELSAGARWAIVLVTLGAMVLTYVGERRARAVETASAETSEDGYSYRTRVALLAGIVGVAVGVYAAVEVDPVVGGLFVLGSVLFWRVALRLEDREPG